MEQQVPKYTCRKKAHRHFVSVSFCVQFTFVWRRMVGVQTARRGLLPASIFRYNVAAEVLITMKTIWATPAHSTAPSYVNGTSSQYMHTGCQAAPLKYFSQQISLVCSPEMDQILSQQIRINHCHLLLPDQALKTMSWILINYI